MKEFENYKVLAIDNAKGGTLGDLIKSGQTLSDEDCAKVIKSVLLGLKHIHNHEYVHRDIKPSNLVIGDPNDYGTVKLVDFGLAIKY